MKKGVFTISLDFELYWGVHDVTSSKEYSINLLNAKKAVSEMLDVFLDNGIGVTWAIVDALRFNDKSEFDKLVQTHELSYKIKRYSPFPFKEKIGKEADEIIFASELVDEIRKAKRQELATHTLSHCYVLEEGFDESQLEEELRLIKQVSKRDTIETIIFPRNQFKEEYLKVCFKNGIKSYRGTPSHSSYKPKRYQNDLLWHKGFRFLSSYFGVRSIFLHDLNFKKDELFNVPASLFLRPYRSISFFQKLKLRRIKKLMTLAAKEGKLFHLWWHPHNFGKRTKNNIDYLIKILDHYSFLEREYQFQNLNISEIRKQMMDS